MEGVTREMREEEGEERLDGGEEIGKRRRGRRDWKEEEEREERGEGGELYLVSSEFPHYSRRWLV